MEIGKVASEVGEGKSGVAGKIPTSNPLAVGTPQATEDVGPGLEAEINIRNGGPSTPLSTLFCLLLFQPAQSHPRHIGSAKDRRRNNSTN